MAQINPEIIITARDEASSVLKKLSNNAEDTGRSLGGFLKNNVESITAGFAVMSGVVFTSIKAFDESQRASKQLDAVLKSTKGAAGVTKDAVLSLAASLQKQTTFSDEAVLSAENLLLTFTNIGKDVFPEATKTVLDMSIALGQDTKNSAIQLGKALQDPILGITALRRVGVNFSEDQKNVIENLVNTGRTLEAQQLILKELNTEFGGSAAAAADTFTGRLTILQNTANDLQETIGEGLVDALFKLTGGFDGASNSLTQVNEYLQSHRDVLMGVSFAILAVLAAFAILLIAALAALAGISAGLALLIGAIVGGIAFLVGYVVANWNLLKNQVVEYIQIIKGSFNGMINSIKAAFDNGIDAIKGAVQGFVNWVSSTINSFKPSFSIGVNLPDIEGMWRDLQKKGKKLGIPGFAVGGIVPGPIGAPQLVLAHGGEEVVPHGSQRSGGGGGGGNGATFNVYIGMYAGSEIEKRNIAQELYKQLVILSGSQNKTVSEYFGA